MKRNTKMKNKRKKLKSKTGNELKKNKKSEKSEK